MFSVDFILILRKRALEELLIHYLSYHLLFLSVIQTINDLFCSCDYALSFDINFSISYALIRCFLIALFLKLFFLLINYLNN